MDLEGLGPLHLHVQHDRRYLGLPVVDQASGKVVAVNNTGNEDGARCTDNNPCEVDENGTVTVRKGINYAQETYGIVPCVGIGNKIDLSAAGCELPKP